MNNKTALTMPRLALVFFAAFALFWSPSFYLNDEIAQAASLGALSKGSLQLPHEFSAGYLALKNSDVWHASLRDAEFFAQHGLPYPLTGSTLLGVLALPLLFALQVTAKMVGVHAAFSIVASAAAGLGARQILLWVRPGAKPTAVAWSVAVLGFVPSVFIAPGLYAEPFLELGALQIVSMAAAAIGSAFLFDLLRSRFGIGSAILATGAYSFATSTFFWANLAKYHSVSLCLLLVALWCYQEGHRSSPVRTALAFALAGLAVWNNRLGLFLLLSLGVLALPTIRMGWKPMMPRAAAGVAGLAFGLLPLLLETRVMSGPQQGSTGEVAAQATARVTAGGLSHNVLSNLHESWQAFLQSIVWTDYLSVQGSTLSLLAISPFAILAAATWLRPWRLSRLSSSLVASGGIYGLALFGIAAGYILNFGAGYDVRHILTLYPFLVIAAAPLIAGAVERRGVATLAKWAGIFLGVFVPFYLVFQLLYHRAIGTFTQLGREFDVLAFNRYGGLLLAGLLLVAGAVAWKGPLRQRAKALLAFDALLVTSIALALFLQVILQLLRWEWSVPAARSPFALWWTDLLSRGLSWMVYSLK